MYDELKNLGYVTGYRGVTSWNGASAENRLMESAWIWIGNAAELAAEAADWQLVTQLQELLAWWDRNDIGARYPVPDQMDSGLVGAIPDDVRGAIARAVVQRG